MGAAEGPRRQSDDCLSQWDKAIRACDGKRRTSTMKKHLYCVVLLMLVTALLAQATSWAAGVVIPPSSGGFVTESYSGREKDGQTTQTASYLNFEYKGV